MQDLYIDTLMEEKALAVTSLLVGVILVCQSKQRSARHLHTATCN